MLAVAKQTLQVRLPEGGYPLFIGTGILEHRLIELLAPLKAERLVVVADERVLPLHDWAEKILQQVSQQLQLPLHILKLPSGEQYKTLKTLSEVLDGMLELGANRQSVLAALGGGVTGDLGGFAAACFMRGIPLLQIPTSLLAFVDSSIGGKTAVNHPQGKNAIGVFKQPVGVVMETNFLSTLPPRQLCNGWFELLKHGIIRDASLFQQATEQYPSTKAFEDISSDAWATLVRQSCAVKVTVVETDEREHGMRAILNFGHSLGHLIETHTQYRTCLHGEAVAAGMLFASWVSYRWQHLSEAELTQIRKALLPLMSPIPIPPLSQKRFCELLLHDKKASHGSLNFILLKQLGHAIIQPKVSPQKLWPLLLEFLDEFPSVLQVETA